LVAQCVPHVPQLFGSLVVSVHVPLHDIIPAGHTHDPPTQTRPAAHACAHVPQFAALVCVFVSHPVDARWSQSP
jgi:hypothetical protein